MSKAKAKKSRPGSKAALSDVASQQATICDGCCGEIDDNEHEAIQCEGSCQKWYHRLCAGVSKHHYDNLADSPSPFICWLCSDILQKAVIHELQQELTKLRKDFAAERDANRSAIEALKEDNATLRDALRCATTSQQQQRHPSESRDWSKVPPRRNWRKPRTQRSRPTRARALRRPQLQRVSHMHKEKSLQSLRTNLANLLSIRIYLVFLDQGRFGAPIVVPPSVLCRRPSLILLQLPVTSSPSRESTQWTVEEPSLLNGGLSLEVMKKHWFSWRRNGTQCKCKPAGRWNLFIDILMIQMLPQPWCRWEIQTLLPF